MTERRKKQSTQSPRENEVKSTISRKELISQIIKRKTKEKFLSESQRKYYDILIKNQITICSGPAGVGKSYISMKAAIDLLSTRHEVSEKWESFQIYVKEEADNLEEVARRTILRLKLRKVRNIIKGVESKMLTESENMEELLMERETVGTEQICRSKVIGSWK